MLVHEKELVKLFYLWYENNYHNSNLLIKKIRFYIDDAIELDASVRYCNIQCDLQLTCYVRVTSTKILIEPVGKVKYGFIYLDIMKVLQEWCKDYSWITFKNEYLEIENHWIKDIQCEDHQLSIEIR